MCKHTLFKRIICKINNKKCNTYKSNIPNSNVIKEEPSPKYIKNSKGRWIDSKTGKFVKREIAEGETHA